MSGFQFAALSSTLKAGGLSTINQIAEKKK